MLSSSVTIVVVPTITAVTANITDRQFPYIHQSHLPILFYVFQRIRHIPPFHLMILSLLQYNPMTGRFQGMNALYYYIFLLKKNCSYNLDALILWSKPLIWSHREKLLDSLESPWLLGEFIIINHQSPEIFLTIGK